MSQQIGEYPFTLLATILSLNQEVIECAKRSKLKNEIEYGYRYEKAKILGEHFDKSKNKQQRNDAIINAIEDGYTQTEIAKYLELSNSAISKIFLESYKDRNSIHGN